MTGVTGKAVTAKRDVTPRANDAVLTIAQADLSRRVGDNVRAMPRILTRCPFCSRIFGLTAGGYAHMREIVKTHLQECADRPADFSPEDVIREAERMVDKMENDS